MANQKQLDFDGDSMGDLCDSDDDNDGLPDVYENQYGLNALNAADASMDLDADGLTNIEEYNAGTLPNNADTDGDGLSDSEELSLGTSPLNPDTDGDGVSDFDEMSEGGDPLYCETCTRLPIWLLKVAHSK